MREKGFLFPFISFIYYIAFFFYVSPYYKFHRMCANLLASLTYEVSSS